GADARAFHTRAMDDCLEIGAAEPRASYLDVPAIVAAAKRAGADAIHPGYGFLSENAEFAAVVEAAGLAFIGPSAESIRAMGDKRAARALATEAGGPVVPGAEGGARAEVAAAGEKRGCPGRGEGRAGRRGQGHARRRRRRGAARSDRERAPARRVGVRRRRGLPREAARSRAARRGAGARRRSGRRGPRLRAGLLAPASPSEG